MRTTIEMPDELLAQAKSRANENGVSLRQFFIEAVQSYVAPLPGKTRRLPPQIGGPGAPRLNVLTAEQIDEAMFG